MLDSKAQHGGFQACAGKIASTDLESPLWGKSIGIATGCSWMHFGTTAPDGATGDFTGLLIRKAPFYLHALKGW